MTSAHARQVPGTARPKAFESGATGSVAVAWKASRAPIQRQGYVPISSAHRDVNPEFGSGVSRHARPPGLLWVSVRVALSERSQRRRVTCEASRSEEHT